MSGNQITTTSEKYFRFIVFICNLFLSLLKKRNKKNNRNHHRICNAFTGYNGNCIGFSGNIMDPVGLYNWSLSIRVKTTKS